MLCSNHVWIEFIITKRGNAMINLDEKKCAKYTNSTKMTCLLILALISFCNIQSAVSGSAAEGYFISAWKNYRDTGAPFDFNPVNGIKGVPAKSWTRVDNQIVFYDVARGATTFKRSGKIIMKLKFIKNSVARRTESLNGVYHADPAGYNEGSVVYDDMVQVAENEQIKRLLLLPEISYIPVKDLGITSDIHIVDVGFAVLKDAARQNGMTYWFLNRSIDYKMDLIYNNPQQLRKFLSTVEKTLSKIEVEGQSALDDLMERLRQ